MNTHIFYLGNTLDVLRTLPGESVHCVVTSPPYWGLRDYGVPGQIGLEPTPEEYVEKMVEVFREVRRVLRTDGTLWLNLGDSYNGSGGAGGDYNKGGLKEGQPKYPGRKIAGLKPKDLVGIPWRVAFALQADGWWLRSDIIWAKRNCMPESVTDRPTKSHEYIFLLTKSERYFYDHVAIQEKSATGTGESGKFHRAGPNSRNEPVAMRNKRDVWTVATQPFPGAHFAVMPEALVEPCILAGTSEAGCCSQCGAPRVRIVKREEPILAAWSAKGAGQYDDAIGGMRMTSLEAGSTLKHITPISTVGWQPTCTCGHDPVPCTVLDPFGGSGTVSYVAQRYGRNSIYIDLNPKYRSMAIGRMRPEQPSLVQPYEIVLKEVVS